MIGPASQGALPAVLSAVPRGLALVLLAGWTLLVWELLTTRRVATEPWYPWVPYAFNVGHAVLFGVQALLGGLVAQVRAPRGAGAQDRDDRSARLGSRAAPDSDSARRWLLACAAAFLYGALLEWRQASIPGRSASGWDLATNAVGAFGIPWALAGGPRLLVRGAAVAAAAALVALLA